MAAGQSGVKFPPKQLKSKVSVFGCTPKACENSELSSSNTGAGNATSKTG